MLLSNRVKKVYEVEEVSRVTERTTTQFRKFHILAYWFKESDSEDSGFDLENHEPRYLVSKDGQFQCTWIVLPCHYYTYASMKEFISRIVLNNRRRLHLCTPHEISRDVSAIDHSEWKDALFIYQPYGRCSLSGVVDIEKLLASSNTGYTPSPGDYSALADSMGNMTISMGVPYSSSNVQTKTNETINLVKHSSQIVCKCGWR